MVYETARQDAAAAVAGVWGLLGLDPVPLTDVDAASGSSSQADWEWPDGLRESLSVLYRPQVERLADEWELDVSGWGPGR